LQSTDVTYMPLTLLPAPEPHALTAGQRDARAGVEMKPPVETKLDRLLKLIPTEVIAIYPTALALAAVIAWPYYEPTIAALGVLAVVFALRHDGAVTQMRPTLRQYVIRCLAFAAWTLVIGNPLAPLSVSAEHAHVFGAVGATFIPFFGYLLLAAPPPA